MSDLKANCPKCGAEFMQSTADSNGGFCLKCKPSRKDHEAIAEGITLGFRILFGFIFAIVFAGIGYSLGAVLWKGLAILFSMLSFPIGFIYGFFVREINSFLRMLVRAIFEPG